MKTKCKLLTLDEYAKLCNVTRQAIYKRISTGKIKPIIKKRIVVDYYFDPLKHKPIAASRGKGAIKSNKIIDYSQPFLSQLTDL